MVLPLKFRLFALQKAHFYIVNAPLLTRKWPSNVFLTFDFLLRRFCKCLSFNNLIKISENAQFFGLKTNPCPAPLF